MAYFGGMTTERPWPRLDLTAALLLMFCCAGVALYIFVGNQPKMPTPVVTIQEVLPESKPANAEILVATEAIWPGQRLTPNLFKLETRSILGIEDKVVRNFDEIRSGFSNASLPPDAPLFKDSITYSPPANVLTARIPEGYRAVAIPVDAESGVEGWARPGAHVDVVWTSKHRGKMLVSTIVENAQVLSAEQSTDVLPRGASSSSSIPSHITLLVQLKDAQKVQLAKASGSLSLNLRGDVDAVSSGSGTITVDSLLRRRDLDAMNTEVQGKVRMNGKDYIMRGEQLVLATTVAD